MEIIFLLILGWVGLKCVKAVRPTLRVADYFIACQTVLMKWSGVDISTAKAFVSDNHVFFSGMSESGASPEQAVFGCCQFLLDGHMTDRSLGHRNRAAATALAQGVIKFMPDSPAADSFKKLIAPYAS